MKKKKRFLSLALVLVLCLGLLPTVAFAAESDFTIEDGVLIKYNGPDGDVVIPDGVTKIGQNAFKDCTGLTSVTIPDGVTEIGESAFCDCTGLTSVTIPGSVTEISESAFWYCTGLTSVTIPDGVTKINYDAFYGCTGLTSVTIPGSVTEIGEGAFYGCDSLTSVTIPDGVTEIGRYVFSYCASLTSVTIPGSVTSISIFAFTHCTGLTNITVAEGNQNYASQDGVLFNKAKTTLVCYPRGKAGAYTIPDSVTKIDGDAFAGCTGLTSVTIPDSVTEIRGRAFLRCKLTDVYYGGTERQWEDIMIVDDMNGYLTSATIHYNSNGPTPAPEPKPTPEPTPAPVSTTAYSSTQEVLVDGKSVEFQCYALKDANGNDTNYIKLRDLAVLLNGSAAQFQVGWDGSVTITTHTAYTPVGGEGSTPFSGDRTYSQADAVTKVNGQVVDLAAFVLNDDNGGGYTYYQLRDLGKALGFNVGWSGETGMFIETDKAYDPAN